MNLSKQCNNAFQRIGFFFAVLMSSLVLVHCSDTTLETADQNTGNLKIDITDAPFPIELIDEANVTIDKIELRKTTEDSTDDGNPFTVVSEEVQTINLLNLTNGVTSTLADIDIDAGSYDLVRLYVADANISVVDTVAGDTTMYDVKVPSGAQTGIKVFVDPAIEVTGGLTTELLLDFNLSKSFIVKGNPNTPAGIKGFNFKPVIRAVNQSNAGSIEGFVTTGQDSAIVDAEVRAIQDSTIASTFSDSTGFYSLIGLPDGTYDLQASKADFDTTTIENVTVTAGNVNNIDITLNSNN